MAMSYKYNYSIEYLRNTTKPVVLLIDTNKINKINTLKDIKQVCTVESQVLNCNN